MNSLLERYRNDRRKLMEFLMSSGLVKELRSPSGSSLSPADLDALSADYVLDCVKSGGVVDVSKATKKFNFESSFPVTIHSESRDSYFLVSSPDAAGSPPRRLPPQPVNMEKSSNNAHIDSSNTPSPIHNHIFKEESPDIKPMKPIKIVSLGLPPLRTGLSDDDLREAAYELMIASMLLSSVDAYPTQRRKMEKGSKLLLSLKRKEKPQLQPQTSSNAHSEVINMIRVQMQISSKMDTCIRRNLVQLAQLRTGEQIDLPQLALGLLVGIFKSDFPNEKLYIKWKTRQANLLEESLCFSRGLEKNERATLRKCLATIRESKEWDVVMSSSLRIDVLSSIRHVASKLSSLPGRCGIEAETYYWTAIYHLNIRLYEKLLFGVFDVLDEGQLIEDASSMLFHLKSIWSTLGITENLHSAIYGWVLFQQFVSTGEPSLLGSAIKELQKVTSTEEGNPKEDLYLSRLVCSRQTIGAEIHLSLSKAIFTSVSAWCDDKLQDYHLHFGKKPRDFGMLVSLASTVGLPPSDSTRTELIKLDRLSDDVGDKIQSYVQNSIKGACARAAHFAYVKSHGERTHALALLANELSVIAKAEINEFVPVFSKWLPECMMISAMLLHRFYGERLTPFLEGVSSLSGDVRKVVPAAYMLEEELTQLYRCHSKSKLHKPYLHKLKNYEVEKVIKPVMLDWLISQHDHILQWTRRAFEIEEWEPVSVHQRHAPSIVEIFRIIEETVSQLFGLHLPVDITHLQALLSIIYHSLDTYLQRIYDQLVDKKLLYPSAPPLTRFTEGVMPAMKRKSLEFAEPDNKMVKKLAELTIPKLCIRLNTLCYIQRQISATEDGIRNSLTLVRSSLEKRSKIEANEAEEENSLTHSEAVDELFATTYDSLRETNANCITKTRDLIGARVIFWDLRDMFLVQLYNGTVEGARLERLLPHIDTVLDNVCSLSYEDSRDMVVLSICRSALEAYVRVLLDGGPTRAYSDSDIPLMEEDLSILKEFFIADGEGLPRSLVEQEAKQAKEILDLYSLESEMLIQMLMTASELIDMGVSSEQRRLEDAQTLVRVLCHKKDRTASKFLKRQYEFPMSSEYEDPTSNHPVLSEIVRSTSTRWSLTSQSSFSSIKKKIQDATSEIRNNSGW
ncbi:protein unc-13 homolog isoform X1 [Raphanus sativus]|uniref:Protein unc-13 homolog isoform X1 n=2 Tax=Raphanus sativus TaxID=3726 RepID=A0A6J0L9H7_RAPSA|nr:protein unc-13 homolog isoform X1 [Raphanus sativus]